MHRDATKLLFGFEQTAAGSPHAPNVRSIHGCTARLPWQRLRELEKLLVALKQKPYDAITFRQMSGPFIV